MMMCGKGKKYKNVCISVDKTDLHLVRANVASRRKLHILLAVKLKLNIMIDTADQLVGRVNIYITLSIKGKKSLVPVCCIF